MGNGTENKMENDVYFYNNRYLTKNGKPILPVMGEFHFSRYPKEDWERELLKMKQGGIEIVATYVFWIHHEEREGEWDFTGCRNLRDFLACCKDTGMKVWLRIGPWAHGECRNGGFPDWLIDAEREGRMRLRTDDEAYLGLVRKFYGKIFGQAAGYMHKDGGPVIGIQIENEYGHCGGPSDREEGMAHMRTLRDMAQELGLVTPYYSATGWGGAYVPEGFLAVLGGYVDAPWAEHTHELPASRNFLFTPFHDDTNIGSDLDVNGRNVGDSEGGAGTGMSVGTGEGTDVDGSAKTAENMDNGSFTFDTTKVPYLTAELGGGMQVTGHRRTYPYPEDIEAQTVCMLGAGANLIGYYMYHGGINPDGKYSTLQESKATGYNNNLPEKSYDFQTCIRENGLPNESFYRLGKIHMFIKSVEELLAAAIPYMPYNISVPDDAEDMETLRACFRYNAECDCGFLFINNHQRKRHMTEKNITADNPLEFLVLCGADDDENNAVEDCAVIGKEGFAPGSQEFDVKYRTIRFDNIHIAPDACLIIPYNLPLIIGGKNIRLVCTNACYLGNYGGKHYFYTDDEPYFEWGDGGCYDENIEVLTVHEAEHTCVCDGEDGEYLAICRDMELFSAGRVEYRQTENENEYELTLCYNGEAAGTVSDSVDYVKNDVDYVTAENGKSMTDLCCGDLFLSLDFGGDMARLYDNGKLIADWFSNGEVWQVALKRYGFPKKLTLKLEPYNENVYYDLPPKRKCSLMSAGLSKVRYDSKR